MLRRLLLPLPMLPLLLVLLLLKRRCCGIRLLLPPQILQGDGAKKDIDRAAHYTSVGPSRCPVRIERNASQHAR